jgi:hypothetical protein
MASFASVTVSMAEDTIGTFKLSVDVSFVFRSAPLGRTAEWPGRRSTSSKVSASFNGDRVIRVKANSVICLPARECASRRRESSCGKQFCKNRAGLELPAAHSTLGAERKDSLAVSLRHALKRSPAPLYGRESAAEQLVRLGLGGRRRTSRAPDVPLKICSESCRIELARSLPLLRLYPLPH